MLPEYSLGHSWDFQSAESRPPIVRVPRRCADSKLVCAVVTLGVLGVAQGSARAQTVVASNYNSNRIVKIDVESGTVTTLASGSGLSKPDGLAMLPNGDLLVANYDGRVLRFNSEGIFQGTFCTPGGFVQAVAVGPGGDVFTVSWASNSVRRYDGSTGAFLGVFGTATGVTHPVGLVFSPNGDLFVQGKTSGNVARLDGQTGAFLGILISGGSGGMTDSEGMALGPDGNLYIGSTNLSAVLRFDSHSGIFLGIFAEAPAPNASQGICFGPGGDLFYSSYSGNIFRFDGSTGALKGTVATLMGNLSSGLISPFPACVADFNRDTFVNGIDFDSFVSEFELALPGTDVNHDTYVNGVDFDYFVEHFVEGC